MTRNEPQRENTVRARYRWMRPWVSLRRVASSKNKLPFCARQITSMMALNPLPYTLFVRIIVLTLSFIFLLLLCATLSEYGAFIILSISYYDKTLLRNRTTLLRKVTLARLAWTFASGPSRLRRRRQNCRFGIRLDRNDSGPLRRLTIEALMELSWCLMSLRPSLLIT